MAKKKVTPLLDASSGYLTTGQVAAYLQVAPRTVSKYCEAGRFPNYHRLPRTSDIDKGMSPRRVPVEDLVAFMKENGIRIPPELQSGDETRVLVWGTSNQFLEAIRKHFREVVVVENPIDFGLRISDFNGWKLACIDLSCGRLSAIAACKAFKNKYPKSTCLAVVNDDETNLTELTEAGFNAAVIDNGIVGDLLGQLLGVKP